MAKKKLIPKDQDAFKGHEIKTKKDEFGNHIISVFGTNNVKLSEVQINSPATFYLQFYDSVLFCKFLLGKWKVKKFKMSKLEKERKGIK